MKWSMKEGEETTKKGERCERINNTLFAFVSVVGGGGNCFPVDERTAGKHKKGEQSKLSYCMYMVVKPRVYAPGGNNA